MRARTKKVHPQSGRTRRRRGVALLLVLVVTAVAITLAYSFVTEQSVVPQIARNVEMQASARAVAESGLRLAIEYISATADWRTQQSDGTWVTDATLGGGTFTVVGEDGEDIDEDGVISSPAEGDGDLADDPTDVLTLTVTGSYAGSRYIVRAVVESIPDMGALLFVVGNASSPSTSDTLQKSLFEKWGWTVTLLDDGASSSSFTTGAAASKVVFVSESVSAATVDTKLKYATCGVVLEELYLGDECGMTQSQDTATNRQDIDILDDTHEITSGLGTGSLNVFTSNQGMHRQKLTIASGATTLANHLNGPLPTLYVVDKGGGLYGGGVAAGRRVQLPWGEGADYTAMTDAGKLITRRSLEWASKGGDGALLGHWKFDDGSGSTATDSSGNGYDGTLTNMQPTSDWMTGHFDGALDFDGSNDYVQIPGFPDLTGSFTITAWIYASNTYGDQRVFCDDLNNSLGYGLSLGDGGTGMLRFFSRGLNPISVDSSTLISSGSWQFVAGVHDASARQRRLYLGSTLIGSDSGSYSGTWGTDSGIASIGGELDGTSEGVAQWRFGGRIDDVRVYDGALTADQLAVVAAGASSTTTYNYVVHWLN